MKFITNNPIAREMRKNRVFGLDVLRALAIILVLIGHCAILMPPRAQLYLNSLVVIDAVTLFFVLSGFLIGRILIKTFEQEQVTFKTVTHFWLRRWFRTLPAYFTVLFLLALIYQEHNKRLLLRYALFLQNFNTPIKEWFTESWSLSIEEWFYLITPLVFLLAIRIFKPDTRKAFLYTSLAFIIAFPLYRLYKFYHLPLIRDHRNWDFFFRMQVTTRLDSLMYGVFGAWVYYYHREKWQQRRKLRAIIGAVMILLARAIGIYYIVVHEGLYSSVFSFSIEAFAVLLILPYFEGIKTGKGFLAPVMTFTSIISYSIYLLNFTLVALWLMYIWPDFGLSGYSYHLMRFIAFWTLSISLSVCLYLLVEHPFLKLRDKIVKDTTPVREPGGKEETDYISIPQPAVERKSISN